MKILLGLLDDEIVVNYLRLFRVYNYQKRTSSNNPNIIKSI